MDVGGRKCLEQVFEHIRGDVHDYMDVGGRAPTVGAAGDARSSCRGSTYAVKSTTRM